MTYTRKQLRNITGLLDRTLRWLLNKLDIQPCKTTSTIFGRPIYHYNDSALSAMYAYISERDDRLSRKGKLRCRGGCNRFFDRTELNSAQICKHCYRIAWIRNQVYNGDCIHNEIDKSVIEDIKNIIDTL